MDTQIPDEVWKAADAATEGVEGRSNILARAIPAAVRVALAAELERIAADLSVTRDEWRQVDNRTLRSSALGHAVQVLNARAAELRSSTTGEAR